MKKILVIVLSVILSAVSLGAQSIKIVRTDVDSSRSGFVTATYTFGFDVIVDGVKNLNGVAFRLNFTQSKFIKFSEWREGSFGTPYVIDVSDTTNTGSLIVGASSGDTPLPDSIVPKVVVHLEFVVLQTAPNGEISTFEFIQPVATYLDSISGKVVNLTANTTDFMLHGFINVWPGDADNSGLVDHLDFAPITKFMGLGLGTKNMRSFQRRSASAIWAAQKVLAWDSAAATYADCDGNGDITVSDMLIVSYNIGLDTNSRGIKNELPPSIKLQSGDETIRVPVYASTSRQFISAAGSIDFKNLKNEYELVNVESGNYFDDAYSYGSINDAGILSFVTISRNSKQESKTGGKTLVYLDFKSKSGADFTNYLNYIDLKAVNDFGEIFDLVPSSSAESATPVNEFSFIQNGDELDVSSNDGSLLMLTIYDLNGSVILTKSNSSAFSIDLHGYGSSVFFAKILCKDKLTIHPFAILH